MDHLSNYRSFKSKKDSTISVDALVDDLRSFHARSSSSIGSSNLRFIMAMYARAGDKDKVYQFFNELKARSLEKKSQLITNEAVLPLLYVHARRVEPSATLQQFQRISEEFGLRPDIKAWNILLSVYARADDLEKVLTCFDDFLASGIRPTKNTFGPVLDICARRGDVDAIEGLFSKAKSHNVPLEKSAFARGQLVLALVNDTDLTAAEKAAELMLKEKREGNLHGSMTPTLNFLITAYAQQQDVSSTMRIYKRYQEEGIALDSYTYAALMQSLILMRQTNAAYKILTTTMPNNNVQAHAFHYSLVIAGFLNEGQLHRAQSAQSRMEKRNVSHSPSSRMAFLRLKALSRFQALKDDDSTDLQNHLPRLEDVEAELRQSLKENDPSERSLKQPRQGLHQTPLHQATPDGYFEFLVLLYGTHGAYNMCKELFETAATRRQGNPDVFDAPVGLLTAVMEGHQRAREHAEVDKCWQLARSQVAMLTRLASVPKDAPGEDDPAAKIAQNRKHLLVRSTRIYFRDLSKRKGSSVIGRMRTIISSLLKDGYGIDNMTWNEYIQYLARTGYMLDAFTACEAYLMPSFVGWRFAAPHYLRKDPRGYLRMELRARDARKHIVMPRYKTLVIMAAALSYVRRQEDMGVELDRGDMVSLHTLRRIAPKTIRAIETMPVLPQEKLQRRFLMGPMAL
jgi:pentatricopeptide repeat-containing protein PET309